MMLLVCAAAICACAAAPLGAACDAPPALDGWAAAPAAPLRAPDGDRVRAPQRIGLAGGVLHQRPGNVPTLPEATDLAESAQAPTSSD